MTLVRLPEEIVETLDTREQFEEWLAEHAWLEHACIQHLSPARTTGVAPERVQLVLWIQVAGGLVAGTQRRMRELALTARDVVRYELPDNWFSVGHCCEGAELPPDSTSPISFVLDVPGDLRLDCESLEVRAREWEEPVPAWFSARDFSVVLRDRRLPRPQEWLDALSNKGITAAWRYLDGPATPSGEVPPNYNGWLLQHADRVASTSQGVIIFTTGQEDEHYRVTVTDAAEDGGRLWRACGEYLGDAAAEIRCGNVVLDGGAWAEHLRSLPE